MINWVFHFIIGSIKLGLCLWLTNEYTYRQLACSIILCSKYDFNFIITVNRCNWEPLCRVSLVVIFYLNMGFTSLSLATVQVMASLNKFHSTLINACIAWLSLSLQSPVFSFSAPIAHLFLYGWILSITGNFTCSFKGNSSILSCHTCYRLQPLTHWLLELFAKSAFFGHFGDF